MQARAEAGAEGALILHAQSALLSGLFLVCIIDYFYYIYLLFKLSQINRGKCIVVSTKKMHLINVKSPPVRQAETHRAGKFAFLGLTTISQPVVYSVETGNVSPN